MEPIPGTQITDRYQLPEAERTRVNELLSMRQSAYDRLGALEQRIQDCTRLLEGIYTNVKWQRNWDMAAIVGYSEETGEVVCMEIDRAKKEKA